MTGLRQASLIEVARTHREAGRLAEAATILAAVVAAAPGNGRAHHQLGLALVAAENPRALEHLEAAVRLEPTNPDRQADLGDARLVHGDPAAGISSLRTAFALAPTREDIVLRLGRGLGGVGAIAEGEGWMVRALAYRRPFADAHVARGTLLRGAGLHSESAKCFHRAVIDDPTCTSGFVGVADALRALGAPREQVMKAARIAAERLPHRPDAVIPVVQYHRDVGEEAEAIRLATGLIENQMEAAARDEIGACGFRILMPDDMVRRIGEFAFQLALHVKMKKLGWLPPFTSILLAPKTHVCNQAFLDCWRPHLAIVDEPALIERLEPLKHRVTFDPVYVRLPDGRVISKNRAFVAVEAEWQRRGLAPLLDLSRSQVTRGRETLRRMGVPDGAWFVCVHVREAGYMKEGEGSSEASRNADISAYLPGFAEITGRGGWIIRLGDPSMKPLPAMPQVIDYASSSHKSEETDIFLAASCRFFFGVASGMSNVASVFGVPVGAANFFPIGEGMISSSDVTVPKLYRERATGRILPFDECLRLPLALTYDSTRLDALGIETIDTDAEDLRDLAVEMLERAEGRRLYDDGDEALQKRWNDRSRSFAIADVGGRIGRGFLRRHRHLFDAP